MLFFQKKKKKERKRKNPEMPTQKKSIDTLPNHKIEL